MKINHSLVFTVLCLGFLIGLSLLNQPQVYRVFQYLPSSFPAEVLNVSFKGFTSMIVAGLLFHYFVTAFFGYVLTKVYFQDLTETSLFIKLTASFFVGYTCLAGLLRILTLWVPNDYLYHAGMVVLLVLIGFIQYKDFKKKGDDLTKAIKPNKNQLCRFLLQIFAAAVFVFLVLMLQIYQVDFSWVGHGYEQFAYLLDEKRFTQLSYFPFIKQHYDELIFHFFITQPFQTSFNYILSWWMTLAVTKLSIGVFLYLTFRKFNLSKYFSCVYSLFIMLGTSSLLPTKYYLLFDSSNPLFFTVHSGRVIGIGLAFFMIVSMIDYFKNHGNVSLLFIMLLGLGLATTSISNSIWILLIYFVFFISAVYFQKQGQSC